ncbi:hypothetical protein AB0M28_06260 [Streptomyces sp. NPDC051940]|uniref:hypothetical protein n=1 Tax=Streptomyces sp. NPDC051940 TaxID=3155675 RepID=UPI0034404409
MSLPTAVALVSLLMSVFAVLSVAAVYSRVRMLEQTALNPQTARFADEPRSVSPALRPRETQTGTLVIQLNDACSLCHETWKATADHIAAHRPDGMRMLGLFATADAAAAFPEFPEHPDLERVVNTDQWAALSEGYTPCVFRIDADGRVADRRFVYRDTDLPALFAHLAPGTETSGSSRAL